MLFSCGRTIFEMMATPFPLPPFPLTPIVLFNPHTYPFVRAPPTPPWKSRGSLRAVENGETIGDFSRDANEYVRNRDICEPIFLEGEEEEERFILKIPGFVYSQFE